MKTMLRLLVCAAALLTTVSLWAADKKVVLITGTASGFGKAVAERLLAKDYLVYGGDIQVEANQYLRGLGGFPLEMDVTSDEQVAEGVARIIREQGRIDVLVNNAGYAAYGPIEDLPIDAIKQQFDVNVYGYARTLKAVLPHMRKEQSGRIIQVSSVVGVMSVGGIGWYAATKHAVEAMSDALAQEVAPLGIQVVKIRPGAVKTGFQQVTIDKLKDVPVNEAYAQRMAAVMQHTATLKEPGPDGTADIIVEAIEAEAPMASYETTPDAEKVVRSKFCSQKPGT